MQLREAVERQEQRIAELQRGSRASATAAVAECVLEDPKLMHPLDVEIQRLRRRSPTASASSRRSPPARRAAASPCGRRARDVGIHPES